MILIDILQQFFNCKVMNYQSFRKKNKQTKNNNTIPWVDCNDLIIELGMQVKGEITPQVIQAHNGEIC